MVISEVKQEAFGKCQIGENSEIDGLKSNVNKKGLIIGKKGEKQKTLGATTQWGTHVKIFSENDPSLGVKTCGESEFDIFEAKNVSLIQGRRIVY
jgi:ribosomal protein S3